MKEDRRRRGGEEEDGWMEGEDATGRKVEVGG